MTEYSRKEFQRLLNKVPETDPSTTAYHFLMQSIEMFNAIALTIDEFLHDGALPTECPPATDNVVPFEATDFPADTKDEVPEGCLHVVVPRTDEPDPPQSPAPVQQTYDAPTVRKALLDARARGVNVKEVLKGFGADGFQAVPADRYADLMAALQAV